MTEEEMHVLLTLKCRPRGSYGDLNEESRKTASTWQHKKSTFIVLEAV